MTLIGKVDKEVIVVAFAKVVNLNMEYDKYILKKIFKTMELINLKSQQYVRLDNNEALQ